MVFAPAPWCRMDRNSPCRTPAGNGSKQPDTAPKERTETVSCLVASRRELKPDMLSISIAYNVQEIESNCGTSTKHGSPREEFQTHEDFSEFPRSHGVGT